MHKESRREGVDWLGIVLDAIISFALAVWWVMLFEDAAMAWHALMRAL